MVSHTTADDYFLKLHKSDTACVSQYGLAQVVYLPTYTKNKLIRRSQYPFATFARIHILTGNLDMITLSRLLRGPPLSSANTLLSTIRYLL